MSEGKTLVVGDLHGCYDEFQQLLDAVPLTADDTIVHIGDLVDRGPYPAKIVDFFMETPNATSLLGNRDDKHIRAYDGELSYQGARNVTRAQFDDQDHYAAAVDYMRTLPLTLETDEALLIHGYYEAGVPLAKQRRDVLLGHGTGENRLVKKGCDPWYLHYDGEKPVVFGHRDYPFLHFERTAYAIDTRCVYGGALTGLLLPNWTLYSVPARQDHWQRTRIRYAHLLDE